MKIYFLLGLCLCFSDLSIAQEIVKNKYFVKLKGEKASICINGFTFTTIQSLEEPIWTRMIQALRKGTNRIIFSTDERYASFSVFEDKDPKKRNVIFKIKLNDRGEKSIADVTFHIHDFDYSWSWEKSENIQLNKDSIKKIKELTEFYLMQHKKRLFDDDFAKLMSLYFKDYAKIMGIDASSDVYSSYKRLYSQIFSSSNMKKLIIPNSPITINVTENSKIVRVKRKDDSPIYTIIDDRGKKHSRYNLYFIKVHGEWKII